MTLVRVSEVPRPDFRLSVNRYTVGPSGQSGVRKGLKMKKIATILMLAVMACPAWADLIVQYDIAEADGIEAQTAAMASHVAASALGVVGARVPNSSQAIPGTVMARRWSTDSSPDPAKYLEFSVSADPGYLVSYDSVTLGLFRS